MPRAARRAATAVAACLAVALSAAPAGARPPQAAADAFVTRDGAHLTLQGKPFRFGGTNLYWLGLDENVGGVAHPTYFRIDDALRTVRAMNATVVRSHTLGTSLGCAECIQPALGRYNEQAFAPIDYAVARSRALGLRLVVPLTDQWTYYSGGHTDITEWLGLADPKAFYTDPRAIAAYKDYISHVLNHVNPYTGLAYKDDPTIMSWSLGNELNDMTPAWTDDIGAHLHRLAPRQLVSAGRQQGVDPSALGSSQVDIVDVHYYPSSAATESADARTVTARGKVYLAGEHGTTSVTAADALALADDPNVTGALSWSLFGHADDHGYVQHDDGFTLHYPGDTAAMHATVLAESAFARTVDGDPNRPAVPVTPPLVTAVTKNSGINQIAWRGSAGADGYRVERSTQGPDGPFGPVGPVGPVGPATLSDNDAPWTDTTTPAGSAWYRVVALDRAGRPIATSAALGAGAAQDAVADPLQTFALNSDHSDGLTVTPDGADVRVAPAPRAAGQITWSRPGLAGFRADFATTDRATLPTVQVSADGSTWTDAAPALQRQGDHTVLALDDLRGAAHVRLRWQADRHPAPLTRASWTAATASPATAAPGAFQQTPTGGATAIDTHTAFSWTAAPNAAYYDLTVSKNADLSDPVIQADGLRTTTWTPPVNLQPNTDYHYRVTAVNGAGSTIADGAPAAFTTADLTVEDFEGYASDAALTSAYPRNTGGGAVTTSLDAAHADGPGHSLRAAYDHGAPGYAGIIRSFPSAQDWGGADHLTLWARSDGSADQALTVQFVANGVYWETTVPLSATDGGRITLPLSSFKNPGWASPGALDTSRISQLSFYFNGTAATGTAWIDSITAAR
ncbi:carbohydrate binding domain-containing protein [Kitasatospora sp. NBC_00315]|uniref:carbohydrate binding domain-containing protein n=1 Tax=Kitasatospora sp. NBC_00315 TaxID=2975963 RepID=UPI00324A84B6